jgi:hypothetical protein
LRGWGLLVRIAWWGLFYKVESMVEPFAHGDAHRFSHVDTDTKVKGVLGVIWCILLLVLHVRCAHATPDITDHL